MLKKVHLTLTALICATAAFSQSGAIKVHMFDKEKSQPIPFANVVVEKQGTQVTGGVTDIDGYTTIKPLDPGDYTVKGVYEGYQEKEITGISVSPDKTSYIELDMTSSNKRLDTVVIVKYRVPLVDPQTKTGQTITKEDYQRLAVKDVNSVAAQTAGVYASDVGGALNVRGARSDATQYIVDGVKITADQALGGIPQSMIDQETVITGGLPAKYGDATGGVVEINTIGASPRWFGSVQGITSELLDPFGYNDVNFSIGGPIISKKDTATHTKTPIIDFILGGEYTHEKDNHPTFVGAYTANADTLAKMQQTPLLINPQGGYYRAPEYLTADQITHTKYNINNPLDAISLNGKIGFRISNTIRVVAGGTFQYNRTLDWSLGNELLNNTENPLHITTSWRSYVRLTQRFPTPEGKDAKQSIIRNAYYSLQAEYGNTHFVVENPFFKDNLFDYGYVGQFHQYYTNIYKPEFGRYGLANYQVAFGDSLFTFKPGTENPLMANYTSELYSLIGANNITSNNLLLENQGILNGGGPQSVYSMWSNTGASYGTYQLQNSNHLRFTADFSADIKNHAVQVGFEYEQNVLSQYIIGAGGLWGLMRSNTNTQLQQLDTNNPILVAQGQLNTYRYNLLYNGAVQSQFDKSLRAKLGLAANNVTFLQTDDYAPSFYSLDMFSASDLLNNGSSSVYYLGYDYKGKLNTSNPSIDDFFNQVDANGNHTYPIAPYHPIYIAGYIQDHFDIKNLKFDVGVRVDRFDANQPVLKDPYLLFPAKTVAEVKKILPPGEQIPANMGDNYIVYANSAQNPTSIVGFRNGNNWYNANGNLVQDPSVIAAATATGTIQPWLENPSQTTISSNAFTTYKPQVNVMPRIAFAFPISDVANFYAHYDILTQRPPGYGYNTFNPTNYMFIANQIGTTISNPALLPTQSTDYELGYTQVLNEQKSAALTISAYYKEMKSEVETYRYFEAYPATYLTYSNIDFGTVKGLSVAYDLRRVNNIKLRVNYTLQFANGTGSGPNSGVNLANSGEPNLQIPQPLSFDQRHTFNVNMDYHYGTGENYNGPVVGKKQIFANAGFNLNLTVGSGTPYTRQDNATANAQSGIQQRYVLVGSINGAYLPWSYRVDLKIDKDFPFTLMKSKGDKARPCDLLVYITATNLLNTQNTLGVYAYTGSPSDDGFLNSLAGQQYIPKQTSPRAFQDQYKIADQNPGFLSLPRELRLGVQFSF